MRTTDKLKRLIEGSEKTEAFFRNPTGVLPKEVRYTKLVHFDNQSAVVLLFDKSGKWIGYGGPLDKLQHAEDPPADMVQDQAPLFIKPKKGARTTNIRQKP